MSITPVISTSPSIQIRKRPILAFPVPWSSLRKLKMHLRNRICQDLELWIIGQESLDLWEWVSSLSLLRTNPCLDNILQRSSRRRKSTFRQLRNIVRWIKHLVLSPNCLKEDLRLVRIPLRSLSLIVKDKEDNRPKSLMIATIKSRITPKHWYRKSPRTIFRYCVETYLARRIIWARGCRRRSLSNSCSRGLDCWLLKSYTSSSTSTKPLITKSS